MINHVFALGKFCFSPRIYKPKHKDLIDFRFPQKILIITLYSDAFHISDKLTEIHTERVRKEKLKNNITI